MKNMEYKVRYGVVNVSVDVLLLFAKLCSMPLLNEYQILVFGVRYSGVFSEKRAISYSIVVYIFATETKNI